MFKRLPILLIALCAAGSSGERWMATSTTASSITGNVVLETERIVFTGGKSLPITRIKNVTMDDGMGHSVPASVYQVMKPEDPALIRGNHICDGRPITYITIWHVKPIMPTDKEGRAFAAFSGATETVTNVKGSCGTFFYEVIR